LLWGTFALAAESGINPGIITSLFSTSLIFASVYFFLRFGQKLSMTDIVGILMVIACVVVISLSSNEEVVSLNTGFSWSKFGAILCSLGCGLLFAINSADIHEHLTTTPIGPT